MPGWSGLPLKFFTAIFCDPEDNFGVTEPFKNADDLYECTVRGKPVVGKTYLILARRTIKTLLEQANVKHVSTTRHPLSSASKTGGDQAPRPVNLDDYLPRA
ncbi:MAG TPA: hypothetical protein V6C65_04590 [Allocoleopsis sp.]